MPSPQNASYTPPTTTPFSSPTDHSRLHRGTTTSPCPRLSLHPPAFASLLMLPWVLHTSHATILYHFGVSRTLSMLMRFYYWIRMDISTRWWLYHCVKCQCSRLRTKQLSGLRFPFRYRTAPTFSSASTLRPFTHHTPGQLLRTPFHRPRQPPRRHVRHY